jgi:hypothetical protein
MTVTSLEDKIEEVINSLDELTWIPQETITDIRNKLEDVSEILADAESEYGDEPADAEDEYEDDV